MSRRNFVLGSAAAALIHTLPRVVHASTWPTKAVRITVPFPAGSGTDSMARLLADKMRDPLGQPVIVENRAGAGGMIGSNSVARAAPDGYSLLMGIAATHASAPNYFKNYSYDPILDFAPITLVGSMPFVLLVRADSPFGTVQDLVALAKKNPGKLSFASIGDGSPHRFAGELLKQAANIDLLHVPMNGAAPALNDLMGGHVDMFFVDHFAARSVLSTGRLRILACTSRERPTFLPDVPTFIELGLSIEHLGWYGVFAPAGTPRPVIERLNTELVKAIHTQDVTDFLTNLGVTPSANTPEEFAAFLKRDNERWAKLIQASGVERPKL